MLNPTMTTLNVRWEPAEGRVKEYKVVYAPAAGGAESMVGLVGPPTATLLWAGPSLWKHIWRTRYFNFELSKTLGKKTKAFEFEIPTQKVKLRLRWPRSPFVGRVATGSQVGLCFALAFRSKCQPAPAAPP